MGVLTVTLQKINHLRDADGIGKSDPYVKFELEKENSIFERAVGKHTSSKKKNDLNPVYNETFQFEHVPTMENMTLVIKGKCRDSNASKANENFENRCVLTLLLLFGSHG